MEKDFVIDQASWHTQRVRNYEYDNEVLYASFTNFINYIQEHNLTTREILSSGEKVSDDTCIKKSDLTEEGYEFLKLAYDKWGDKVVDKKILPNDFRILDKALKKIRP